MNISELGKPLDISDIDFRVQSINNGGYATILAYKDARVDMARLDSAVGALNWQRDYKLIDGKLFCGVAVYNDKASQWIWKWDVGVESNTEKEKGQASDSFKRACFNWGIGRELYNYPLISVKLRDDEWTKDGGRPKQTFNLKIKDWVWYAEFDENGNVSYIGCKDERGAVRFQFGTLRAKDARYKKASDSESDSSISTPQPKVEQTDDANIAGFLKKEAEVAESIPSKRDALAEKYKELYGKAPHGRMSGESIQREIDNFSIPKSTPESPMYTGEIGAFDENGNWVGDTNIEDEGEMLEFELHPMQDEINKISSFTSASEFVNWARSMNKQYESIVSADKLEEFKVLCNNHYAKIKG